MPLDEEFADRTIDRRTLIRRGIAFVTAGGLAAAMPPAFLRVAIDEHSIPGKQLATWPPDVRAVAPSPPPPAQRVFVIVQLAGGNDGLNTVIPYTDGAYFDARRDLALDPESLLHLDDRFALHPSLGGLKQVWDRDQLAIVQGVGYPNPNRSHFRSMDIWHTASMGEHSDTGWLGRLLDATSHEGDSLWRAANVGRAAPRSLAASETFVPSLGSVPSYVLATDPRFAANADRRTQHWLQLYASQAAELATQAEYGGQLAFVSDTGLQAYDSTVALEAQTGDYTPSVDYPKTPLAQALQTVAQLASSNLGTMVCYVTTGGFDTHAGQSNAQAGLLQTLGDALLAFTSDLEGHALSEAVTTMVWTEFGRRVGENGSGGTDHGTAGPAFLLGGSVRGGLHGEPAAVSSLDGNGDLKFTTDFRSIYASVIEQWFEADPADVLDGSYPTLPLLL
jgi:uncharacterized protein (DUF1501 family)